MTGLALPIRAHPCIEPGTTTLADIVDNLLHAMAPRPAIAAARQTTADATAASRAQARSRRGTARGDVESDGPDHHDDDSTPSVVDADHAETWRLVDLAQR